MPNFGKNPQNSEKIVSIMCKNSFVEIVYFREKFKRGNIGGAVRAIIPENNVFGSSDFYETFRRTYSYLCEQQEGWSVWSPETPYPRPENCIFQHTSNLVHQISTKLWGNIIGIKRKNRGEFGHMLHHSCLDSPCIQAQIRVKLGSNHFRKLHFSTYLEFGLSDESFKECF